MKRPSKMSDAELDRFLAETIGTFFAIPLDGEYGFARVVRRGHLAGYDLKSRSIPSLDAIEAAGILFVVPVYFDFYVSRRWKNLGKRPLSGEADKPAKFFRQDPITGFVDIYSEGKFLPHTDEDLSKLECLGVCSENHIESRLKNHFAGRPDPEVEASRYKPLKTPAPR
jgi:hypothetical protein